MVDHDSVIGGAEISLQALVSCMPSSQCYYTIALPWAGPLVERLREKGFTVKIVPLESWRWWIQTRLDLIKFILTFPLQMLSLLRWLRFLRAVKPDLIHFNISRLVEPVLAARLLHIPSIVHFRDIPSRMRPRFVLGGRAFYAIMSLATCWIANSTATGEDICAHANNSISTIPNGIDLGAFDELAGSEECIKVTDSPFTVAMVALLVPWKNHHDYVRLAGEVCRKRNDVVFLIVGSGEPSYVSELAQLANDLDVGEKVRFFGHVENIPALLKNVDLLLHTTEWEPFGRVFIEAMAARKAVVAFDCGGAAEIVVNGETGVLVPTGNIAKMGEAVCRLLDDPSLRSCMGEAGRRRVEGYFTLDKHCGSVAEVYDDLLARC
jgi:glycosyltransferase involved in cell wall biosynthesis